MNPDLAANKQIAVAAEMFSVEEVDFFDEMFGGWLDGSLEGHQRLVAVGDDDAVLAASNYAPRWSTCGRSRESKHHVGAMAARSPSTNASNDG